MELQTDGSELAGMRVLVADDDAVVRRFVRTVLESRGAEVFEAADGREALLRAGEECDAVLLDVDMPEPNGLECLRRIRQMPLAPQVVMFSSEEGVGQVAQAMKLGAFWYLSKRAAAEEIAALAAQAARHTALARDYGQLRGALSTAPLPPEWVGSSAVIQELLDKARRVAAIDATVLLTGESGTGKSLLARFIHACSARRAGPFVTVSCAALPGDLLESELFGHERGSFTGAVASRPGRIELAEGGTLFLDEVGDLPLPLQPKLLVFLQERVVQRIGSNRPRQADVRIIAATNQDLEEMCAVRSFREDLFFRLNVVALELPPLRRHAEDIIPLAEHHLRRIARQRGAAGYVLAEDAGAALRDYPWPGNVRELENVLERASAFCRDDRLTAADLNLPKRSGETLLAGGAAEPAGAVTLEELERRAIIEAYKACGGNKAAAARRLGISEKGFYTKVQRLGLQGALKAAGA